MSYGDQHVYVRTTNCAYRYDEDVLLPLSGPELSRRLPPAALAALAAGGAAVPVVDSTAAPGMLVRRQGAERGEALICSSERGEALYARRQACLEGHSPRRRHRMRRQGVEAVLATLPSLERGATSA
jgi:hypothetical protein